MQCSNFDVWSEFNMEKCSEIGLLVPTAEQLKIFRDVVGENTIWVDGIVSHVGSTLVMVRCRRMTEFYDEIINHKLTPHPYMLWQDDRYGLMVSYATT